MHVDIGGGLQLHRLKVMFSGQRANRIRELEVAGLEIGNERQRADGHRIVCGDWREHIAPIDIGEA
jgi:hypothetical protein